MTSINSFNRNHMPKGPDHTNIEYMANDDENVDEIEEIGMAAIYQREKQCGGIMGFNITKWNQLSQQSLSTYLQSNKSSNITIDTAFPAHYQSLDHYFLRPQGTFLHNNMVRTFDSISYSEYFCLFRLAKFDGRPLPAPKLLH